MISIARHLPGALETMQGPWALTCAQGWLVARFAVPQRAASWAMIRGGLVDTQVVAWLQVCEQDLRPPVNPVSYFESRLRARGLQDAIGLMTSRAVETYATASVTFGEWQAHCLTTVGLGNALRIGDTPGAQGRIGTINTLVHLNQPLSDTAFLEALAMATEARAAAMLASGVVSQISGRPATGTGTDCIVVCAPRPSTPAEHCAAYAGKHTTAGHVLGQAVLDATHQGIARCLHDYAARLQAQASPPLSAP